MWSGPRSREQKVAFSWHQETKSHSPTEYKETELCQQPHILGSKSIPRRASDETLAWPTPWLQSWRNPTRQAQVWSVNIVRSQTRVVSGLWSLGDTVTQLQVTKAGSSWSYHSSLPLLL
jgi:hypothetical protein